MAEGLLEAAWAFDFDIVHGIHPRGVSEEDEGINLPPIGVVGEPLELLPRRWIGTSLSWHGAARVYSTMSSAIIPRAIGSASLRFMPLFNRGS